MVAEACSRLGHVCPTLANIIHECCIPSPSLRPSSSHFLPLLDRITLLPEGTTESGTPSLPAPLYPPGPPPQTLTSTPLLSPFPSTSGSETIVVFPTPAVVVALESLGLVDAISLIGNALLEREDITKPELLHMLTSAGVSLPIKARLLLALSGPPPNTTTSALNIL